MKLDNSTPLGNFISSNATIVEYGNRTNRNKIELSYPFKSEDNNKTYLTSAFILKDDMTIENEIKNSEIVNITCLEQENYNIEEDKTSNAFIQKFRYMYHDLNNAASEMSNHIHELAKRIADVNNFDADFQAVDTPVDGEVLVYGRIIADSSDGKLNSASLLLEGDDFTSQGRRVKLDISELREYSLFPGQTVVVRGNNTAGRKLVAKSIYYGEPLPFATTNEADVETFNSPVTVMVAAGPFHLCPIQPPVSADGKPPIVETLQFGALADLLNVASLQKPDVLILIGPFIDSNASITKLVCDPYDRMFNEMMEFICGGVDSATSIVIVPSTRDIIHHHVFPQPPFGGKFFEDLMAKRAKNFSKRTPEGLKDLQETSKIYLCPNPCTLRINDMIVGVLAEDIFFDLSKNMVFNSSNQERLNPTYLLNQHCYYPKYPSENRLPIDFSYQDGMMFKEFSPDILITPSNLNKFVKESGPLLCINPERLTKSETGGTFAYLTIHPLETSALDSKDLNVVVKNEKDESMYFHRASSRTRVDIVRI